MVKYTNFLKIIKTVNQNITVSRKTIKKIRIFPFQLILLQHFKNYRWSKTGLFVISCSCILFKTGLFVISCSCISFRTELFIISCNCISFKKRLFVIFCNCILFKTRLFIISCNCVLFKTEL